MSSREFQEVVVRQVPLGRPAQPDEIADTAFVIASNRARFVTGQVLCVIGGHVASKRFNDGPRHAMVFGQLRE
jgi:NAD(P)-dependent dehydrogenase (short-subunit alcohol dehydrogenase family)